MATVAMAANQRVGQPGSELNPSYEAIATGNTYTFPNNRRTILHLKKSGAGAATITFVTPATLSGLTVEDPTYIVDATTGDEMIAIGKLAAIYNDGNGLASFTTSEGTGLTGAVVEAD